MAPNDRTTLGIYRRVAVSTWDDEKFKGLSRPAPNAQTLFFFLLTGPLTRAIPGTVVGGLGTIADHLAWPPRRTERCWDEIATAGMAVADWKARLVWLPNGLRRNPPTSLDTIDAWRAAFPALPECELRRRIEDEVTMFLRAYGLDFVQAWLTASDDRELDMRLRRVFRTTPALRDAIKTRDRGACRFCGRKVSWTDRRGPQAGRYVHVDPVGPTEFANLVTACRACGSRKGHLSLEAAGLVLRPEGLPGLDLGTDLGTDPGRTKGRSWPQEEDQDQEYQEPPLPPSGEGGRARGPETDLKHASRRITRQERADAVADLAAFRRRQPSYVAPTQREPGREYPEPKYCPHEPECRLDDECIVRIVVANRERLARVASEAAS